MTHVLFHGDIRQHPGLRSLFWQLGVTVGPLASGLGLFAGATVEDCDAVVSLGTECEADPCDSGAMPDGAGTEGAAASAAAPLLVIGTWSEAGSQVSPWISIPDPGPGGSRLRAALQSCQERSRVLRGDPHFRHDKDLFRNFLGHELRSPLTAIKTAIAVLAAEKESGTDAAKMLAIAQRNLSRLAGTVEWSQELQSLADALLTPAMGPVSLICLAEALPDQLDVQLDTDDRTYEVMTDPRMLGMLAIQMERVFAYACPANRPAFRLSLDPDTRQCRLSATAAAKAQVPALAGRPLKDDFTAEMDHLVRMMMSPNLMQVLGVRTRLATTQDGAVELYLSLPGWTGKYSPLTEPSLSL